MATDTMPTAHSCMILSEITLLESFTYKIINMVVFIISIHSSTLEQIPFARN